MSLFAELKRRNVIRVAVAYLVVSWLVLQVADVMIDNIGAPEWVFSTILMVLGIGFPVAMVFTWAFEMTPEGIKRDQNVDRSTPVTAQRGRKLDVVIIATLVLALAYFFWESRIAKRPVADDAVTAHVERPSAANAVPGNPARSIAILPFLNMSSDPEQDYFSDGMTEEIINAVVKIPGVQVPARTSVFGYKGHQGDIREVGLALGVAYLLEGSIRSYDDQVRITAQLIKVDDGFHLWSETYDRKLENIFAVQEEIAGAIAGQLVGELGESVDTVPNRTRDMAAYDLYLQGRAALRSRNDSAIDLLTRATEADPDFASAWAALAIAYQSVSDDNAGAIETADRALALDPDNVDALDAKASALRDAYHWQESEALFDRALAIDPHSAELLEDYAEFLNLVGRSREALQATTRGVTIDDALVPLALAHVEALLSNGRPGEAVELAKGLIERMQSAWPWYYFLIVWRDPSVIAAELDLPPAPQHLTVPAEAPPWADRLIQLGAKTSGEDFDASDRAFLRERYAEAIQNQNDGMLGFKAWRVLLIQAGEVDALMNMDVGAAGTISALQWEWLWTPLHQPVRQHADFPLFLARTGLIDYWDATEWPDWCRRDANDLVTCQ